MSGRFFLLLAVILGTAAGGCASVSEERVARLESAVMDLQTRDIRLAALEETVAGLVAGEKSRDPAAGSQPGAPEGRAYAPRRVFADASPAPLTAKAETGENAPPVRKARATPPPAGRADAARAAQQYRTALATFESGRPQAAMPLFRDFLSACPNDSLAPNAGYWLGECYYSLKQYDSAIIAFKDVVAQHPTHDKAAAAMLKAGYSYAQLGDIANARFYLEALVRDFPSSQPASLARARLATL